MGTEDGIEEFTGLINIITTDSGIGRQEFVAALIAFIAFNMTTIPCFAACAAAKGELAKGKFRWTLLFWVAASYVIGAMVYTVGSWIWPLAVWAAVFAIAAVFIVLRNTGKFDITKIFKRKKKDGDN